MKTLRIDTIWNLATFNLYTVPEKILYLQRYSTDFRNLCLSSMMLRVGIWADKVSSAQVFYFYNGKEKILRIVNIWNFVHFQPVHCANKNPISPNDIQPIFEIFASGRRCWGWAFGWKVLGAQVFYFCNGKVKTLRMDNIWNFATFNLYNVPAKILYLQRYSTDFRNLCLSSKMLRVGIWVESFMFAGILLLP